MLTVVMDATDENTDVKFHRASTDLLLDIEKRLGHFKNQILDSRECSNRCRYVANSQALKIIDLVRGLFGEAI
ncbi:hypothetical protein HC762_00940 [bacterium]|nr:hypothetical protein [bacterium]